MKFYIYIWVFVLWFFCTVLTWFWYWDYNTFMCFEIFSSWVFILKFTFKIIRACSIFGGEPLVMIQIIYWFCFFLIYVFGNLCFSIKDTICFYIFLQSCLFFHALKIATVYVYVHITLFFMQITVSRTASILTASILEAWRQWSNTFKSLREN